MLMMMMMMMMMMIVIILITSLCCCDAQEQKMSEMIHVKVRLAQGSDSYVIRDVSSDDEGRYFCRASNEFGVKEASVDVRMLGQ